MSRVIDGQKNSDIRSWNDRDAVDGERLPFLGGGRKPGQSGTQIQSATSWGDSRPRPLSGTEFQLEISSRTIANSNPVLPPPKDVYKLVYAILLIHGVGTLMPWNMFITARSYFVDYKLENSTYSENFLGYIGFASQIPNVIFNWLNIFIQIGGNLKTRIVWSIVVEVILFIATIALAMIDTSNISDIFFWLTMVSVVLINMANGIYQNSVYGIAAKLDYAHAVILGSNISGTFTSLINILSIALTPDPRTAAIYYFITALFVLLTCFDTYFALPLNKFYRYHEMMSSKENEKKSTGSQISSVPRLAVLKKCWPQCLNVFLVFFVSLTIFPALHSEIKMVDKDFFVPEKFFIPITCFLTFNIFAMIGNLIPSLIQWPGPRFLWVPVVMRFLFIPFFIFCKYEPKNRIFLPDQVIFNDWAYWAGASLLGLTSGYYSSLSMIYCSRSVPNEQAPIAGMFGAAFLITGIFSGVLFTLVIPWFLSTVNL